MADETTGRYEPRLTSVRADVASVDPLDQHVMDRLVHAPRRSTLSERVRTLIVEELKNGEPSAARVAGRLRMSVRTLNRLLTAEGTSHRKVLDGLRHEMAARHLSSGRMSLAEIAFLLGFSEVSAFHRAFKRWTGVTPRTFQQQHGQRVAPQ